MADTVERIERRRAMLAELAELGMALARDAQARALAAEDDAASQKLNLAFQRAARTVRQTLALDHKLERDTWLPQGAPSGPARPAPAAPTPTDAAPSDPAPSEDDDDAADGDDPADTLIEARMDLVRQPLLDDIDTEVPPESAEPDDWRESLMDDLENWLESDEVQARLARDATRDGTDRLIADLRDRMGLWGPEPAGRPGDPHIDYGAREVRYEDGTRRTSPVRRFLRPGWIAPRDGRPARQVAPPDGAGGLAESEDANAPSTPSGSPSP